MGTVVPILYCVITTSHHSWCKRSSGLVQIWFRDERRRKMRYCHKNIARLRLQCRIFSWQPAELDRNTFHPAHINYRQTMSSTQLSQHAMHVVADRLLRKPQLGGDLLICKTP